MAFDLASGLKRGQTLSEPEVADLQRRDQAYVAVAHAVRLLARRPRSRREIERHLGSKDFDDSDIQAACDHLSALGHLDDRAFAEWWISNRSEHRPRGAFALRSELLSKGVGAEAIGAALSTFDETAAALKLAGQRAPKHRHLGRREFETLLGGYLQRRGFAHDSIREALNAVAVD